MVRDIFAEIAEVDKDISVLRVEIMVPAEPPLGLVEHLGKYQRRTHTVQNSRAIEYFIRRGRSADIGIDEILARAPLRHDARAERISTAGGRRDIDVGIFFLKQLRDGAEFPFALKQIKRQRAFLLCSLNRPLPFRLPVGSGISAVSYSNR